MKLTYLDIKNSVIEQIQAAFAKDRRITVKSHAGNFDEAEVRRLMQSTPAILTSLVEINDEDEADECYIEFVSWVLYRADNRDKLYDGALSLVSALIGVIKNIDNPASYGGGKKVRAECLYTGSLDKINATLWAVRWRLYARAVNGLDGVHLPDDLDWFKGYEATLKVEKQKADDSVNLE